MLVKSMCLCLIIIIVVFFLSLFMKPMKLKQREKLSPFECGFDPHYQMRSPFSLRFFLITILFLIFDMEIIVMLPIPMSLTIIDIMKTMNWNMMLFFVLTLGLLFEWSQGALTWTWNYI